MKRVAKLVIVDGRGKYLLMQRSNHPVFGNDPDLPGGTLEEGELPLETMLREVFEEAAVVVDRIALSKFMLTRTIQLMELIIHCILPSFSIHRKLL